MTALDERPAVRSGGPAALIRRHPLISFFVLADLLSWLAWIPFILSRNGLGLWDFHFPELLGSPQFAGMLPGAYLGPLGAAFIVTALVGGRRGLRVWVSRVRRFRVELRWYAVALLTVPVAILGLGTLFSHGDVHAPTAAMLLAYVPLLLVQLVTTGLAEEPGWRDFALPPLHDRFGPLRAALILGPLWALWHMPLFLTQWGGWPHVTWTQPIEFAAFTIAFNVIVVWLFNRTGQSLPIVMLFHTSVNNTVSVFWVGMFPALDANLAQLYLFVGAAVVATVLVVVARGRLGLPSDEIASRRREPVAVGSRA